MKIYLSGKVSNLSVEEYTANFKRAADLVLREEHTPVNPIEVMLDNCKDPSVCGGEGKFHHWTCYMKHDLRDMLVCDAVAALPNWFSSSGAKIEVKLADDLKMPIFSIDKNYEDLNIWRNREQL